MPARRRNSAPLTSGFTAFRSVQEAVRFRVAQTGTSARRRFDDLPLILVGDLRNSAFKDHLISSRLEQSGKAVQVSIDSASVNLHKENLYKKFGETRGKS